MNLIRNILLGILFMQFLIFLYVKLIYEQNLEDPYQSTNPNIQKQIELETLVQKSVHEIMTGAKELPQSSEYTLWDEKMIAKLNNEIENFNNEMRKIVEEDTQEVLRRTQEKEKEKEKEKGKKKQEKIVQNTKRKKKTKPKISITKKIEKYAKAKLGQKYVWGAVGPKTFDCSGFTKNVFLCTTGIKIPRVSRDQAKVGTYIKYKDLRRGDMVFFDTEKKFTGRVNHVGIYLSGNNFIHASSARKKVIITNFKKKPFYKRRFLWGRRIIKNAS